MCVCVFVCVSVCLLMKSISGFGASVVSGAWRTVNVVEILTAVRRRDPRSIVVGVAIL